MNGAYYQAEQWLAQVDLNDKIVDKIEKWKAHKEGILHRGYTAILEFEGQIILQHRKHPVFDGVYDLSFSSHQLYKNGKLQSDTEAICEGLKREWGVEKQNVKELKFLNKIYYKSKDPKSEYIEHEVDYVYLVRLEQMPVANIEYAYGKEVMKKKNILVDIFHFSSSVAPWVSKIMEGKLI